MKGKSFFAAVAGLSAGLAAGYLLAQHVGIDFCCAPKDCEQHRHGAEKPPLRVKPVPIVRNAAPKDSEEENGADDTPEEDTE